jgi:hypothetical protein
MCTDKEDENRYTQVYNRQKQFSDETMAKERQLSAWQKGQVLLIWLHLPKECKCWPKKFKMRGFRCWTVDTTVAFFFYVSNHEVSFNIAVQFADSPFLTAVVDQYIEFDQQHSGHKYNAATRCKISGPLLESAYEDTTRRDAGDRLVTATLPFRSDDAAC